METFDLLSAGAAIIIGFTLGLVGGGGSILTVPALVYISSVNPVLATAYSLFVVGLSSLVGAVQYMRRGLVSYKTAVVFAVPSFIAVYITRAYIVPIIPENLFYVGAFLITKNIGIMLFFGAIMLFASISMIRTRKQKLKKPSTGAIQFNYPMILLEGSVVGMLTGLVGAGGGFLIIPALVLLARLPMKLAVGTSLLIIAVKSLIGFLGDVQSQPINWNFLLIFSTLAVLGIFIGVFATNYIPGRKLKKGFGWFVLIMAVYIIGRELLSA